MRRTMPVAFIFKNLPLVHELYRGIVCRKREIMQRHFLPKNRTRAVAAVCGAIWFLHWKDFCAGLWLDERAAFRPDRRRHGAPAARPVRSGNNLYLDSTTAKVYTKDRISGHRLMRGGFAKSR